VTSGDYLSGFIQGTRQALYENERDSITVTIPKVNPYNLGALIALYERAVGFYGSLVKINAYHQPGVEAGKKAAVIVLELQHKVINILKKEKSPLSLEELAQKAEASDKIETIYKILRHLAANKRGIIFHGNLGQIPSLAVSYH
ncbi:MAG: glucose-6-phosphate isomerase, partial [Trichodesmium sp. MAG_R04]|nr:glucose-6-phosphate isomerase [Trichodesmium sp. MAG_R04]